MVEGEIGESQVSPLESLKQIKSVTDSARTEFLRLAAVDPTLTKQETIPALKVVHDQFQTEAGKLANKLLRSPMICLLILRLDKAAGLSERANQAMEDLEEVLYNDPAAKTAFATLEAAGLY